MKSSKKIYLLIFLILLQSFCVFLLIDERVLNLLTKNRFYNNSIRFKGIISRSFIVISIIFFIIIIFILIKKEKEYLLKLKFSKEVIDALQSQKHDFINHLSLISGMIQLEKHQQALEYIFKISDNEEGIFAISKIENAEVAALLGRKCAIAEKKEIKVDLDISTSLEELQMNPVNICKVLFNLIDNAIYELERYEGDKILTIYIYEHENFYVIEIGNSYPVLSKELYSKIFEKGYSTKKDASKERGYGLYIVKKIIEKNRGAISVESYEGLGTIFTIFLPINNKKKSENSLALK